MPEIEPPINVLTDVVAVPDWAIREAFTALAHGGKVPDVESQLIAKGLASTQAAAATEQWFVRRFHLVNREQENNAHRRMRLGLGLVICGSVIFALWFLWYWYGDSVLAQWFRRVVGIAVSFSWLLGARLIYVAWTRSPLHSDDEVARHTIL